jgi:SPP1 family predicted phage head-tail adaptor
MATRPEINAGALDRRVILLKPTFNTPEDEITGWEEVATVWASVNPSPGTEVTEAGRTVASALVPIIIRYRTDIDARWRVRDRDQEYALVGKPLDIARRHVQLQLNCEEVL